jgi:hypothetical protein
MSIIATVCIPISISTRPHNFFNQTYLPILHNRHNNLALARPITRNVSRILLDVLNQLRSLRLSRRAAHAAAERDDLTRDLSLEWT